MRKILAIFALSFLFMWTGIGEAGVGTITPSQATVQAGGSVNFTTSGAGNLSYWMIYMPGGNSYKTAGQLGRWEQSLGNGARVVQNGFRLSFFGLQPEHSGIQVQAHFMGFMVNPGTLPLAFTSPRATVTVTSGGSGGGGGDNNGGSRNNDSKNNSGKTSGGGGGGCNAGAGVFGSFGAFTLVAGFCSARCFKKRRDV